MRTKYALRAATVVIGTPLLGLIALGVFGACTPTIGPDAEGRAWVASHRSVVPTEFESIARQPENLRKPIYATLGPELRLKVWQAQVESFVLPASELSETQRATANALEEPLTDAQRRAARIALDSLSAVFDESSPIAQRQALANRLCAFNRSAFTRTQASTIFGSIGPSGREAPSSATASISLALFQSSFLPAPAMSALRNGAVKVGLFKASMLPRCDCNSTSWCGCDRCSGNNPQARGHRLHIRLPGLHPVWVLLVLHM